MLWDSNHFERIVRDLSLFLSPSRISSMVSMTWFIFTTPNIVENMQTNQHQSRILNNGYMCTLKPWQTWTYNNSWSIAIAFDQWTSDHWNTQMPRVHRTQVQGLGWDLWHHTITWLKLRFQHLCHCGMHVGELRWLQPKSGKMMQQESTSMLKNMLSSSFFAIKMEILTPTKLSGRVLSDHIHGVYLLHLPKQELGVGNTCNCRTWIGPLD